MPRRSRLAVTTAAVATLLGAIAAAPALTDVEAVGVAPDEVPDRGPLLSEPMERGELLRADAPAADVATARRAIDADSADWRSESSRIGGTARWDAGEHVYADYVHDAWGADDGTDAQRLGVLDPVAAVESRTTRFDALFQALGAQFGAPDPVGADEAYGDELANDVADLTTLRLGLTPDGRGLDLHLEVSNLTEAAELGVLVLADTGDGDALGALDVAGLTTERFDRAVLLTSTGAVDATTGAPVTGGEVAVDAGGWTNALEARLPADLLAPAGTFRGTVVTGRWDGDVLTPANVAYRGTEPVAGMYNDKAQALALLDGTVDDFVTEVELADMAAGRTEQVSPGPGYHERTFLSAAGISAELREDLDDVYEDTRWQRYALFVPSDHVPGAAEQATFWLHYRGGKAHSGGAWSPRLFTQLGEEVGGIVVTPHGRGERRWYEGSSHQDFWEVYDDLHNTFTIDPARRYLSGYSMGGHGSPMMGLLYPDRFAGVYTQAAAIGRDLFDVTVNAEHVPFWLDVSAQDGLVQVNQDFATALQSLGHRYVAQTFVAGEHYTQAILDEWAAGARYLQQQQSPGNPRSVTYRVVPSLVETINDGRGEPTSVRFDPDGAWWVDGIEVTDGAAHGTVRAEAHTLPGVDHAPVLDPGDVRPGDHSVASVRHGQAWESADAAISPLVEVDLTDVAAVRLDAVRWHLTGTTEVVVSSTGAATVSVDGLAPGTTVRRADGSTVPVRDGSALVPVTDEGATLTVTP